VETVHGEFLENRFKNAGILLPVVFTYLITVGWHSSHLPSREESPEPMCDARGDG
jgi:hypothetical protein